MRTVVSPERAEAILRETFLGLRMGIERVESAAALGRVLAEDVAARFSVPGFVRAAVDGYAVRAAETFGCSQALPAVLTLAGEVRMGEAAESPLPQLCCMAVPTGGALPEGADAMVMVEDAVEYGDGTVGVEKPAAPGAHLVFAADDLDAGAVALCKGTRLAAAQVGVLAALGSPTVSVYARPRVAILSTGDELLRPDADCAAPGPGRVYDVNGPLLAAAVAQAGGLPQILPLCPDDEAQLAAAVAEGLACADLLLLSGGSSVGRKDAAARVLESCGELLLHGIALKPGKPTIFAAVQGKPVFGLPGHPAAAHTVFCRFVRPLLYAMQGLPPGHGERSCRALLSEAVPANHGREACLPVRLEPGGAVRPIAAKSGLIAALAAADGFVTVPRDAEGLPQGAEVLVTLF